MTETITIQGTTVEPNRIKWIGPVEQHVKLIHGTIYGFKIEYHGEGRPDVFRDKKKNRLILFRWQLITAIEKQKIGEDYKTRRIPSRLTWFND